VNIDIQEGKVALYRRLHGELDIVVILLRCRRKSSSFSGPQGLITKMPLTYLSQQRGLWVTLLHASSYKSSMKKLTITGDRDESMATLFIELPTGTEKLGSQDMAEKAHDVFIKRFRWRQ
jgi:hypothetical protein